VLDTIAASESTLVFTNTRSQAESWYQAIVQARPQWEKEIGLHHGSMSSEEREAVETGLQKRQLRAVVCTSSLDLGVDFAPVDRVIQIGSPKGVARLLQRAGRSGHQPGQPSRVSCVPTHALQLIEVAAARRALAAGRIEARQPLEKPMDVLVQHLVTLAAGGGFEAAAAYEEVRSSDAYRDLSREEFDWALNFVVHGGASLKGHPEYHRVMPEDDRYVIRDKDVATRHRLSIGTISSDASMRVQYQRGGVLGTIEESFLARLRPGDTFLFAGRTLELIRTRDMTAYVRTGAGSKPALPRWMGGSLPLSTELAEAVRQVIAEAAEGSYPTAEMTAVRPLLELQRDWSALPRLDEILIERFRTREGHHLVIYPFAGRLVHEGLAAVLAWRLAQLAPISFAFTANDYGIELVSASRARFTGERAASIFSTENLLEDIHASLNLAELAKRQFRGIARVAGLVFTGYPWARKNARQFQASSGLFYDVFRKYDPDNLLLAQALQETLEQHFEYGRMVQAMTRIQQSRIVLTEPRHPTPLAFPLIVDRMRGRLSSEKLADRVARMQVQLERAAG
jgi:ATP-dependent Lhr-like helicase